MCATYKAAQSLLRCLRACFIPCNHFFCVCVFFLQNPRGNTKVTKKVMAHPRSACYSSMPNAFQMQQIADVLLVLSPGSRDSASLTCKARTTKGRIQNTTLRTGSSWSGARCSQVSGLRRSKGRRSLMVRHTCAHTHACCHCPRVLRADCPSPRPRRADLHRARARPNAAGVGPGLLPEALQRSHPTSRRRQEHLHQPGRDPAASRYVATHVGSRKLLSIIVCRRMGHILLFT